MRPRRHPRRTASLRHAEGGLKELDRIEGTLRGDRRDLPHGIARAVVDAANTAPCAKSRRGVVVFCRSRDLRVERRGVPANAPVVLATASNGPPGGWSCDGKCRDACGQVAMHAEQRAILAALQAGYRVKGADVVHVKTVDGRAVPSGVPSCLACSKFMVETKIARVWLYQARNGGAGAWYVWSAEAFHVATLAHHAVHGGEPWQCQRDVDGSTIWVHAAGWQVVHCGSASPTPFFGLGPWGQSLLANNGRGWATAEEACVDVGAVAEGRRSVRWLRYGEYAVNTEGDGC